MTVVGAVSATGAAIPPLLVVPGVRLFMEDIAALSIKGSAITGDPIGNVAHLKKRVVLIVDNSSTQIDAQATETCVEYGIMLVTLPANATHLFQQLDVALFKPFKDCVHDLMLERLCPINDLAVRKTNIIEMACTAYRRALIDKPTSAIYGFRKCGIWPLSLVELRSRLVFV
ncbi:hypothetical protein JG688_00005196 [Phytophthora aleatoria]|uniref:DDE-1 domain-containing protein n=1 Tax=Phytophthora aleatoria TaxID=2496075 RepID=A0A8J5J8M1_9STRA|nr:hypothetical protein JG688_00005196 [Phytophthora aleatoria]